jgi:hypothetical protein
LIARLKAICARRSSQTADKTSQDAAAAVGGIVAGSAGATAPLPPPRSGG